MMREFLDWHKKVEPEIRHVQEIMSERLSDEPAELIGDLSDVEAWNARMGSLLAEADSWLDKYTLVAMPPREGRTEADRKALVDSETSPLRFVRDQLDHLCDAIKQRLILGESALSFYKAQYAEKKPLNEIQRVF